MIDYRQRLPDDRVAGFLHSIDAQTDRLNGLLDDLVLMAKIQAGALRLQLEPIALRTVIEQAIDQLPPDQRGGFSIEGSDPQIMADAPYLRRAFALLFQHVCETATAQTIIRLELTTTVQVWLSGTIDPELDNPLARVDQLIKSTDPSRGRQAANLLRLALSRAVIELHGGSWAVEERSVDAPTLCVTLPLARSNQTAEGE